MYSSIPAAPSVSVQLSNAVQLLPQISADEYDTWFRVGCALKRLGADYEVFRDWSATSEKFDEDECRKKWDELPDEPRSGITTLRELAQGPVPFMDPPSEMLSAPTNEEEQLKQSAEYLITMFGIGESIELCGTRDIDGRLVPDRAIENSVGINDTDTLEGLVRDETLRSKIVKNPNGVYVGLNPFAISESSPKKKGPRAVTDEMITDCRIALLECDKLPIDRQFEIIRGLRLPVKMITYSGNKSLHILCKVDAGKDSKLYAERVAKLHAYATEHGLPVDAACKNPSRLTRLPGAKRDDSMQYIVTRAWGYQSWDDFERMEFCTPAISKPLPSTVEDIESRLTEVYGRAFSCSPSGKVTINQSFFAAYCAETRGLCQINGVSYQYNPPTGLWLPLDGPNTRNNMIARVLREFGKTHGTDLCMVANAVTCRGIESFIESPKMDFLERKNWIHTADCMLELTDGGRIERKPFSPDYHSLSRTPVTYDPDARCNRFINELLRPALPEEDIEVLQRYCGQCLLGDNITQTILVITGTAGGGKGTICNIIEKMIGVENYVQLRTDCLNKQFETSRFIGKTLLEGKDVLSDFLMGKHVSLLKSLCGNDRLSPEIKNVAKPADIRGRFNIIITANDRLKVRVDGDIGAWKRRLLWIPFTQPPTNNPIPGFDELLFQEEGAGILNWMVEGAVALLRDKFSPTCAARTRIDELLQESDSVYGFVREMVEKAPGKNITRTELYLEYARWCCAKNWDPYPERKARQMLDQLIAEVFRVLPSNNLKRDSDNGFHEQRGYRGLAIKGYNANPSEQNGVPISVSTKLINGTVAAKTTDVASAQEPASGELSTEGSGTLGTKKTKIVPSPKKAQRNAVVKKYVVHAKLPPAETGEETSWESDEYGIVQPEFGF